MVIYNIHILDKDGGITMSVGANIKKRRFELRMSQQELADAMGYKTRSTIAKIESGENDISQKKLNRLAAVLDTTPEALIAGRAEPLSMPVSNDRRKNRNVVLILAGGKTGRNRQNIPSQFISVQGKPIIVHCMEAYQAHPSIDAIFVVCLRGWEEIVRAYAAQYGISKLQGLIAAGSTGIASLKNGVDHIVDRYADNDVLFIQESTRPMVRSETISTLLRVCGEKGSATICHPMRDYVQFSLAGNKPQYVNRDTLVALQSPEAHTFALVKAVFHRAAIQQYPMTESCFAMLMNNLGFDVHFVENSINNIKLAREEDLAVFSAIMRE